MRVDMARGRSELHATHDAVDEGDRVRAVGLPMKYVKNSSSE